MDKAIALARLQWESGAPNAAVQTLRNEVQNAHILMAHYLLSMGNYAEGFKELHYRRSRTAIMAQYPNLHPEPFDSLSYIGEQGIGDQLFFARWIPKGSTYYCDPKIAPLLDNGYITPQPWHLGDKLPTTDAVPVIDLAGHDEPLPAPVEIFTRYQLKTKGNHNTIGVAWESGTPPDQQRGGFASLHKHVPANIIINAVHSIEGQPILLQRNPDPSAYEGFIRACPSTVDYCTMNDDLPGMIAGLLGLSAYIGPSSTLTHILGSLNIPCFILVPYPGDWRTQQKTSPWYPSHKHYFQNARGDWTFADELLMDDLQTWNQR